MMIMMMLMMVFIIFIVYMMIGQDGIGRVWKVDVSTPAAWKVTLSSELKGHSGPIMALAGHPDENWVSWSSLS